MYQIIWSYNMPGECKWVSGGIKYLNLMHMQETIKHVHSKTWTFNQCGKYCTLVLTLRLYQRRFCEPEFFWYLKNNISFVSEEHLNLCVCVCFFWGGGIELLK